MNRWMTIGPSLFSLLLAGLPAAPFACADGLNRDTLQALKQGTVFVRVEGSDFQATGSGFLLGKVKGHGYVVTNSHVITNKGVIAKSISVVIRSGSTDERQFTATVAGNDEGHDLAILKIKDDELPDIIESNERPDLYETLEVFILGFPFGSALSSAGENPAITVSKGAVSSIRKNEFGEVVAVQIDGSINPGNSGGPIVTADGKLVGIAVARLQGTTIGFAIPSHLLRELMLGRISRIAFKPPTTSDGKMKIAVVGELIDPLNRIKRCAILLASRDESVSPPKPDKNGVWRRAAKNMTTFELKKNGSTFVGEITLDEKSKPKDGYLFQPAIIGGDGKLILSQPGTLPIDQLVIASNTRNRIARPAGGDWLGATGENGSGGAPEEEIEGSLAGPTAALGDLRVKAIAVQAETLVPFLAWSDDADFVYTLSKDGLLRKISVPYFQEEKQLNLGSHCSFLGRSRAGLVIVVDGIQQVCTVDEKTLEVSKQIRVAGVNRVACSPNSTVAFAASGSNLVSLDLRRGKVTQSIPVRQFKGDTRLVKRRSDYVPATGVDMLTMSPNGKYLFSKGGTEMLQRIRINGEKLVIEEFSPRIGQNAQEIVVSEDSKYVAMPSGGGNYPVDDHPKINYGTYIYDVTDLQSPRMAISSGAYPRMIAMDPVAQRIYAHNHDKQLIVFTAGGVNEGEYALSNGHDEVKRFLVHPAGHRLMVLTSKELLWVDLTKYDSNN